MLKPHVSLKVPPSDQGFYFILQLIVVVDVMLVIPVELPMLGLIPLEGACLHPPRPLD